MNSADKTQSISDLFAALVVLLSGRILDVSSTRLCLHPITLPFGMIKEPRERSESVEKCLEDTLIFTKNKF